MHSFFIASEIKLLVRNLKNRDSSLQLNVYYIILYHKGRKVIRNPREATNIGGINGPKKVNKTA